MLVMVEDVKDPTLTACGLLVKISESSGWGVVGRCGVGEVS